MKLYHENGFLNIPAILAEADKNGVALILAWGGRGTGKTYGALDYCIESGKEFMLMRRTQTQLDVISKPEFSPFKSINRDRLLDVRIVPASKYNGAIYRFFQDGDKHVPEGAPIGYTCALSTVANIRGFDASTIKLLIYDEFIPEQHERPIRCECDAFLNAYETINRNRELSGEKPLVALCLANANTLTNPLFMGLGIVAKADKMIASEQEYSIDRARGIMLLNLCKSPIAERKKQTAIYRIAGEDADFTRMAVGNEFYGEHERAATMSRPLREYKPVSAVGELCIYQHKSNGRYFCSTHISGSPPSFGTGEAEKARFRRAYGWLWREYMERRIDFESRICEILLTKYVE